MMKQQNKGNRTFCQVNPNPDFLSKIVAKTIPNVNKLNN